MTLGIPRRTPVRFASWAAILVTASVLAASACHDASAPTAAPTAGTSTPSGGSANAVPATVAIQGPSTVLGLLAGVEPATPVRRYSHTCLYHVSGVATGAAGASAVWGEARWAIMGTGPVAGTGTALHAAGTLTAAEVGAAFGGATVTPAAWANADVRTSVTFDSGPEPRGAIGAHHAHWEFDYVSAGKTQTAVYEVDCTPMVVTPVIRLRDARTGTAAAFATMTIGGRAWLADEVGVVRPQLAAGLYDFSIGSPQYAPQTGTILIDLAERLIAVTRLGPQIDSSAMDVRCDSTGTQACVPRLTVYDAAGATALPEQVATDTAGGFRRQTSTGSEVLDAYHRRYSFVGLDIPGLGESLPSLTYVVTDLNGIRTRARCWLRDPWANLWRCDPAAP